MSSILFYIGPGVGIGTIILVSVILALVLFSLGYVLWVPLKRLFRKKDK